MKKLTLHLLLFLFPIFLGILIIPISPKQLSSGLKNDCHNRASWMYSRLYENSKPIDLAFIGSSRTMNSVNDRELQQELPQLSTVNFAYCRYGRNLQLRLLKNLVEKKHLQYLVLEVRVDENPFSHPIFPYLATNKDLIQSQPLFNKDYISDWSKSWQYRLQLSKEKLWGNKIEDKHSTNTFGFTPQEYSISINELDSIRQKRLATQRPSGFKRDMDDYYPEQYLKRISKYCKSHNIKLYFLYLPALGRNSPAPNNAEKYREMGSLLLPPSSIFTNLNNWTDGNHLNRNGSEEVSDWLLSVFAKELN